MELPKKYGSQNIVFYKEFGNKFLDYRDIKVLDSVKKTINSQKDIPGSSHIALFYILICPV